jgi:predicted  nucleic acid-binding Zn-ribbon protein
MESARCIRCNKTFTEEELVGATCCPGCGTKDIPCDPKKDAKIVINVQDLRILGIWAENYAVTVDNKELDNPNHRSLKELVNIITDRIEAQLKEQGLATPLTLSKEFSQVKQQFPGSQMFRDGREEV